MTDQTEFWRQATVANSGLYFFQGDWFIIADNPKAEELKTLHPDLPCKPLSELEAMK